MLDARSSNQEVEAVQPQLLEAVQSILGGRPASHTYPPPHLRQSSDQMDVTSSSHDTDTMCSFLDTSLRTQHTPPDFFKLLQMKPSPTWSIDSRQTTPEIRAEDVVDEATHWRNACELSRQRLLDIGITAAQIEAVRFAHHDPNDWKAEANLYDAEFWRLQQKRQSNKGQKKKKKTKASPSTDAPISSRLRRRTQEAKVTKSLGKARDGRRGVKQPIP